MATYYSSLYKQNPIRTTLYEPIAAVLGNAGITYKAYWTLSIPVGVTTADIIKLVPFQTFVPVTVPQIAGIRPSRAVLRCGGNVGGSVTANFGFSTTSATAFGSSLTTLQSATTLDVPIATIMAAAPVLGGDDLSLVIAAGTSTTVQTVDGFIEYYMQAP